ncbi:MAG: YbjQ family protein [Methanimicrococcus sp.]|nr:YbjQ family protein [Methanimicrococcus sp.]
MLLVNTETIAGKEIESIGLVKGTMVQSKNIGRDITQALKSLVGGELTAYTEMMNESRDIATQRMVEEAEKLGADAIVNVRYASSSIMKASSEILAYGTAVKFK